MIFNDQINREIQLSETPNRIVSLVPSQTELLVDLGLEEKIVGVTKFCVHPKNLRKEKKIVGGTKKVHYDKIKTLRPDVILCNKEENTEEMVQELKKIAPVHVSHVKTMAEALEMIAQYGEMFGVPEKASEIIAIIQRELDEFRRCIKERPIRKVAYFIWKNPWMVAGKGTFINHLLELNHFENVFAMENSRYPEVSLEAVKEKNTELVLLSTEPFPFQEKHKEELQKQLKGIRIKIVDGEFFSWYGSRLIKAFRYFKHNQF